MRHARALGSGRLRGADVEAAIDLARVGRDDLGVRAPRRASRASAVLPARGRPDEADDARPDVISARRAPRPAPATARRRPGGRAGSARSRRPRPSPRAARAPARAPSRCPTRTALWQATRREHVVDGALGCAAWRPLAPGRRPARAPALPDVVAAQQARHRAQEEGAVAERLAFEARAPPACASCSASAASSTAESCDRLGHQQGVPRHGAARMLGPQALEAHALVRRVLIDQDDPARRPRRADSRRSTWPTKRSAAKPSGAGCQSARLRRPAPPAPRPQARRPPAPSGAAAARAAPAAGAPPAAATPRRSSAGRADRAPAGRAPPPAGAAAPARSSWCTACGRRKRTSSFAGCTLTSTSPGAVARNSIATG